MFGNNYAFDIPQALESEIEQRLHINEVEFNLLYSVFALPNIGLSIGGGMMIDKIGGSWGILTFSFMVWISQFAIAFGGAYQKFYMMLVGRAIFGVASDMLFVSISKVLATSVKGSSGFAIGVVLTVPELACALNAYLSPYLFERSQSLTLPLVFGQSICLFSFICGLLVITLVSMAEERQEEKEVSIEEDSNAKWYQFSTTYIILMLICTLTLAVYVPFLDNVSKFYQERFGWTQKKAGRIVMLGYIIAALSSPFVGWLSDSYQKQKGLLIILSTSLFLVSHLQFFLLKQGTNQLPNEVSVLGLVTLGLGYAFYSSVLLPALQETVDKKNLGRESIIYINRVATAMGVLGVGENVCLTVVPLISGFIYGKWNKEERMRAVDSVYLGTASVAFILSLRLYRYYDTKTQNLKHL